MRATDAVLLALALLLLWSFYRAHKDPANVINAFDLVMEGGRLSRLACAFAVTMAVTSWIMIRLVLDGKMTEGYFTAYGLMWIAPIVAKLFSPPPTAGTIMNVETIKSVTSTVSPTPPAPEDKPPDDKPKDVT